MRLRYIFLFLLFVSCTNAPVTSQPESESNDVVEVQVTESVNEVV